MDPRRLHDLKVGKGSVFKSLVKIFRAPEKYLQCVKSIRTNVAFHFKMKNPKSQTNFDDGKEHDPVDFMRALLDCMSDEFEENKNWIKRLTEFVILEEHSCPNCSHQKQYNLTESIFQVDVKPVSLHEAVMDKLKTESIEKGSGFNHACPIPINEVTLKKSLLVYPDMFLIQVNRFEMVAQSDRFQKSKNEVKPSQEITFNEVKFTLEASINHEGNSMETGHCICNVFEPKSKLFHRCSDSSVTKDLSGIKAQANQVYLAVYSKCTGGLDKQR